MAITHNTPVFSVDQAKVYAMLTDPAGGSATYGTGVALPGVRSVAIDPDVLNKELFGDNIILALAAKTRKVAAKVGYAKLDLDVLPILTGASTVDTGTTPNQVATYTLTDAVIPVYFKLEFRILSVELPSAAGGGSLNVTLHKCKITNWGGGPGAVMEDFQLSEFDLSAIRTNATGNKIMTVVFNETLAALS